MGDDLLEEETANQVDREGLFNAVCMALPGKLSRRMVVQFKWPARRGVAAFTVLLLAAQPHAAALE